jgi:hypothetical protein
VSSERDLRDDAVALHAMERKKSSEVQAMKLLAEDALKREIESRKRVESMLRGYKDEVETLSEALKIAAVDIAEAAMDQMREDAEGELVGEDEFFEEGGGEGGFVVNRDGTFEER